MGQRYRMQNEKADDCDFRIMEVVMVEKKGGVKRAAAARVVVVDNHQDTLHYVQENMDDFINNVLKTRRLEQRPATAPVAESSELFEKNLQPLFTHISETTRSNILDKLSTSLKKALLIMALERYHEDRESVCRVLGLTPERLEKEIVLCGLDRNRQAA